VQHRTIQINHQTDAKIFQFIIVTFVYSSTCFGGFPAHHQELNDCSGSLWFYLRIVVFTFRNLRRSSRNSGTYMNMNVLDVGNECSFNFKEFIFIPNFGLRL